MGIFGISFITLCILFPLTHRLFRHKKWHTINYNGKYVPYNIGSIFFLISIFDFIFVRYVVKTWPDLLFFTIVWFFGFIDDVYGKSAPKGLKGHISLFYRKRIVSTGLMKAGAVVIATTVYFFINPSIFTFYNFLIFIFLPHMMNLLDTKPLRVWKCSLIILIVPFIEFSFERSFILFLFLLFLLWFIDESSMKGMLGDNGAMLAGGFIAFFLVQLKMSTYTAVLLFISILLTIIAERISIQQWVENTPIIKQLDRLGRIK